MSEMDFFNTVTLQVESLFDLAPVQAAKCFDRTKLGAILTAGEFSALRRVVLTGCGDSYSAAGAMRGAFSELSGIRDCFSPDPMDFTRFWTDEEITGGGQPTLVVAISASGSADRIVEILERGKKAGARTMLISNNPESKGAKAAELFYHVDTPELCNTPGLRSYFASMVALAALGTYIGVCSGKLLPEIFERTGKTLTEYVLSCQKEYRAMNDLAIELGATWKDFSGFDIVGDGADYFSAQFVEEKFIECAGSLCSHTDSEDWCHINFFLKNPSTIGTIFHAFKDMPNFSRVIESADSAIKIGRPVLVVTDASDTGLEAGAHISLIPSPPEGYAWMAVLMDFVPGSLLAGYVAAEAGTFFFGGRYNFRTKEWNMA